MSDTRFVALLRGINVGGKNIIAMKDLVQTLESIGCTDVQTYIQSGNVVFSGGNEDWTRSIADTIQTQNGFEPAVLVMSKSKYMAITEIPPFPTENGKALHVFFLKQHAPDANLDAMQDLAKPSEAFALREDALFLYAPDGIGKSKLAASTERLLGVDVTARNWNTIVKLQEMLSA